MKLNRRGFTLTEVLIATAIVGVLTTIGVPSYRRMTGRARKIEAKVNLGKLYAAEQTFFADYQAYGNNLYMLGYRMESNDLTFLYSVGFSQVSGCAGVPILPAPASIPGQTLAAKFSTYYSTVTAPVAEYSRGVTIAHNGQSSVCVSGLANALVGAAYTYRLKDGFDPTTNVNKGSNVYSYVVPGTAITGESNGFFATADGVISNRAAQANAVPGDRDIWFIDHERTMVNAHDGNN